MGYFGHGKDELKKVLAMLPPTVMWIEGDYSGGNDSGGLDRFTAYDAVPTDLTPRGNEVAVPDMDEVGYALDDLLSVKFGSWAGDWSASGTLFVDVASKKAWTEGQMEVSHWEEDSEALGVQL